MCALRAERVQLIGRLQNYHALPAHRNDDKFILLELGRLIAGQMRWPRRPGLWQRFEVTNDWVNDTDQPAKQARTQEKIQKMAARRRCRSRPGQSVHCRFLYAPEKTGSSFILGLLLNPTNQYVGNLEIGARCH